MRYMLKVSRLDGDKIVLRDEFDNSIILPRTKLPADLKEADVLYFNLENENQTSKKNEEAKDILNEILSSYE